MTKSSEAYLKLGTPANTVFPTESLSHEVFFILITAPLFDDMVMASIFLFVVLPAFLFVSSSAVLSVFLFLFLSSRLSSYLFCCLPSSAIMSIFLLLFLSVSCLDGHVDPQAFLLKIRILSRTHFKTHLLSATHP